MKTSGSGGENSSARKEAGEEASLPKPEQQEVCGEIMALMGIARRV